MNSKATCAICGKIEFKKEMIDMELSDDGPIRWAHFDCFVIVTEDLFARESTQ